MKDRKKMLSDYIDQLNQERKPVQHEKEMKDAEWEQLMSSVRRVKSLREEEALPDGYQEQLISALRDERRKENFRKENKKDVSFENNIRNSSMAEKEMRGDDIVKNRKIRGKKLRNNVAMKGMAFFAAAAAVAAVVFVAAPRILPPGGRESIVYAMEKAFQEVKAYHGTLVVEESNEQGERLTQAKREVWADDHGNYYVRELEGTAEGIITVNNGEKKWQLRPQDNEVCLLPTFPDPYRFTFELEQEIEEAKLARKVKEAGEEIIAGRAATVLEITPEGGDTYRLWVDKETKLPLQRETAMRNAVQYRVTYTSIEFVEEIPGSLLQYQLPGGYTETDNGAEQIINTIEEAQSMVDFIPKVAIRLPEGYALSKIAIQKAQTALNFYYALRDDNKTVVIRQSKASEQFRADSMAVLGQIGDNTAEIMVNPGANSVRWQEGELEYTVLGDVGFEVLMPFLKEVAGKEVTLPAALFTSAGNEAPAGDNFVGEQENGPEVWVEIDRTAEGNEQKSVDAGHSPWKLDPAFVAQVFASLLLSPEGIEGDYPIAYDSIEIIENDGRKAVARINDENSIASCVYLERLIRQDETGIWTVTGYDRTVRE